MTTPAKTRTAHCEYCDADYQTTGKPYRGKGKVFDSCGKAACAQACCKAYNTAREEAIAARAAAKAAAPRQPQQQRTAYGDYAWMCLLANPGSR